MGEGPTIPICRIFWIAIASVALTANPVLANRSDDGAKLLSQFVEARLADSGEQPERAIEIYQDSLKQQPDNVLVAGKAYVKAIETGNWDLALRAVRSIELSGNLGKEMPALLFADALQKGNWESAETALAELESLGNFAFLEPMLRNWVLIVQNDKARVSFKAIENNKTAAYYLEEQKILTLLAIDDDSAAKRYLRDVISRNDVRMAPVRMIAARHYIATGDRQFASEILGAQRTVAEARLRQKIDSGETKQVGQRVTAKLGAAYTFQRLSADLGIQRASFLALVMAQVGANIVGDNDFNNLVLGRAYVGADKGARARASYQNVQPNSPYFVIAKNAEIRSYLDDELYDEALDRVQKAIMSDPELPEFQVLLGQVYLGKGDQQNAVKAYEKAVFLANQKGYAKSALASYYLTLGSAQEQSGLWPAGLRSIEKANELLPNSANILNYLGYTQLERRENTQQALAAIKQAYELRSSSAAITDSLGWAYFIIGEHDKAVDFLEKALAGQPQDPTINEHLGDAYWTVGRKFEARYAWKSAKLFVDQADEKRLHTKIDMGLTPELISP